MVPFGVGTIVRERNKTSYYGTFPDTEDSEKVIILKKSDLELLLKNGENTLLKFPYFMRPGLYECDVIKTKHGFRSIPPKIVDELQYHALDGTEHKLFLDHHLYSPNLRDNIWVRWCSVDISFIEEQP